uniref:Uncharacterized protein n=1 Tax=Caenorhabditis japonica TaxID=281687 RepID=A0A8R1DH23_CAEJA
MGRRAIVLKDTVPKDTVLKFSIQRVVVPKDPSDPNIPYPKIPYPSFESFLAVDHLLVDMRKWTLTNDTIRY